jgi:hypothetical protein
MLPREWRNDSLGPPKPAQTNAILCALSSFRGLHPTLDVPQGDGAVAAVSAAKSTYSA